MTMPGVFRDHDIVTNMVKFDFISSATSLTFLKPEFNLCKEVDLFKCFINFIKKQFCLRNDITYFIYYTALFTSTNYRLFPLPVACNLPATVFKIP